MEKAIRIECFQNLANYRKPSSFIIKESYPLPPYSTILGMIHTACGYSEFHPMKLSVQGNNGGSISEMYTRYSFTGGTKYDETRHQLCVRDNGNEYGIFKGVANVQLICNNHMIIHIIPSEKDFDYVYKSMMKPQKYLSLGRYEDLLDISRVEMVELELRDEADANMDIYVPIDADRPHESVGYISTTVYSLTKEYEITKQGIRRWKTNGGRVNAYYVSKGESLSNVLVDSRGSIVALA